MILYKAVCCSLSLFLNMTLSCLILFKSPNKMGTYKYLMLYISIFEAFYSILDMVTEPIFHSHDGAFVVMRYFKDSIFDRDSSVLLVSIYCGCFGFSVALFGVHFIYRYGSIETSFHRKYLSGKKVSLLFITPCFYYTWWAGICYHFARTSQTDSYMEYSVLESYNFKIADLSYVCVLYHPIDDSGESHPDLAVFGLLTCIWFMVISSMTCVLYFGYHCYSKIKKFMMGAASKKTQNLQHQIFNALVIQTMIPMMLMYIPAAVIFTIPMIKLNLGFGTTFVGYTIATYPAIDPLPNMLIIRCYLTAIIEFCSILRPSRRVKPNCRGISNSKSATISKAQ